MYWKKKKCFFVVFSNSFDLHLSNFCFIIIILKEQREAGCSELEYIYIGIYGTLTAGLCVGK